jgi:hypothetical protein
VDPILTTTAVNSATHNEFKWVHLFKLITQQGEVMKSAFKEGASVEVYLLGDRVIAGKVISASDAFVEILEQEQHRGQSLGVRINYSSISHMYPDVEMAQVTPPGSIPLRAIPQDPPRTN